MPFEDDIVTTAGDLCMFGSDFQASVADTLKVENNDASLQMCSNVELDKIETDNTLVANSYSIVDDDEVTANLSEACAQTLRKLMKQTEKFFLKLTKGYAGGVLPNNNSEVNELPIEPTYNQTPDFIEGGQLRSYQIRGLNWLISLHNLSIAGGILADEMGLGKTIQTIAFLAHLKHVKKVKKPSLVVVPLSILNNWMQEFAKWAPTLNVFKFYVLGQKAEHNELRKSYRAKHYDVLLTTYEFAKTERYFLHKTKFECIFVDEGHRIKNDEAQSSKLMMSLHSSFRFVLTGTPLQNNLGELWAILHFLFPKMYRSKVAFTAIFNEVSCLNDDKVAQCLQMLLRPILFRRTKKMVEQGLPPKCEMVVYVDMTPLQRELYKLMYTQQSVKMMNNCGYSSLIFLRGFCHHLRKCVNHPFMFPNVEPLNCPMESLVASSGKLALLDKMLARFKEQGHRVLIFSYYIRMADILEDYVIWKGYKYCRIRGNQTGEVRQQKINLFNNNPDHFIFLLNPRTGGLGINLCTADTVIFYDSDFNPQVDLQAMDRAHRIGQTKPVRVFRLIARNTCDERLLKVAEQKKILNQAVIDGKPNFNVRLDAKTLLYVIRGSVGPASQGVTLSPSLNFIHHAPLEGEEEIKPSVEGRRASRSSRVLLPSPVANVVSIPLVSPTPTSSTAAIKNENEPDISTQQVTFLLAQPTEFSVQLRDESSGSKNVETVTSDVDDILEKMDSMLKAQTSAKLGDGTVVVKQEQKQEEEEDMTLTLKAQTSSKLGDDTVVVKQEQKQEEEEDMASMLKVETSAKLADDTVVVKQEQKQEEEEEDMASNKRQRTE